MKILTLILSCLTLMSMPAEQHEAENIGQDNGFTAKVRGMDVKIEFYSPGIVRVLKYAESSDFGRKKSFVHYFQQFRLII